MWVAFLLLVLVATHFGRVPRFTLASHSMRALIRVEFCWQCFIVESELVNINPVHGGIFFSTVAALSLIAKVLRMSRMRMAGACTFFCCYFGTYRMLKNTLRGKVRRELDFLFSAVASTHIAQRATQWNYCNECIKVEWLPEKLLFQLSFDSTFARVCAFFAMNSRASKIVYIQNIVIYLLESAVN